MSLVFGVYMSIVGVAVVFITLLAVAAACEMLRRLVIERAVAPPSDRRKLARIAAISAVDYYMGFEGDWRPQLKAQAESRWSAVARVEALMKEGERFR